MQHGSLLLAKSSSAPHLLGVSDLVDAEDSVEWFQGVREAGPDQRLPLQMEIQETLASILQAEFGVERSADFADFEACLAAAKSHVRHFEGPDRTGQPVEAGFHAEQY
jgi:hypothetical protein